MTHILGFGGYAPLRVVTNDDWAQRLDTSDEWITQRTGIKRRHYAADDESTLTLAADAAATAIKDADLSPEDIDEIVLATDTPEMMTPDTAALVQHRLGCRNIPTYDLGGSGCAGFVQALDVARSRILVDPKKILVIGVELISRMISQEDRSTAVLFGDGAGAVVMGPEPARAEVLGVVSGTDGGSAEILTLAAGGTRNPFNAESLASGDFNRLVMDGRRIFVEAVQRMSEAAGDVLAKVGRSISDVKLVIPHQANMRIIEAVRKKLGLEESRVYVNIEEYGNTGSATVPFALYEAVGQGRIEEGDLVVLTAFGAGFHWAAAAVQF
ncbi:MAG TPA: beta-ketoacyl-ACP synthase 3 [Acidimicrobiia bacterium]|jgi:3-oxoacyl-[acyl-carrier-protein] synthase-3|nr:beta-ketoacyl-ACP synthase 3 [Acidimicrobiia bacterium]